MSRRTRMRAVMSGLIVAVAAIGAGGCTAVTDSPTGTDETNQPRKPDIAQYITPRVAEQLRDGRFVLQEVPEGHRSTISRSRAADLAVAYMRTFGSFYRGTLERQHGAPIDFQALTSVVEHVLYGASPFVSLSPEHHPGDRKGWDSYWLVPLTDGDDLSVMVAVSVLSDDLSIVDDRVRYPLRNGNAFRSRGISAHSRFLEPEEAIVIAAEAAGVLVDAVPQLALRGPFYTPFLAHWEVILEREVTAIAASGEQHYTRRLFVGQDESVYVADVEQPSHASLRVPLRTGLQGPPLADASSQDGGVAVFDVALRLGHAVAFDKVTITR